MPARKCRHCRTESSTTVWIMGSVYCNAECRQAYLDLKNAKRQIAKRAAMEVPPSLTGDWTTWTLWDWERFVKLRAERTLAAGPQLIGGDDE